jgi:hypothetical protein
MNQRRLIPDRKSRLMNFEEVLLRMLIANAFLGLVCYVIGTAMYKG